MILLLEYPEKLLKHKRNNSEDLNLWSCN